MLTVVKVKDRAKAPNEIAGQNQLSYEFVDRFPPQVISVRASTDTTVEVQFSEPMEKTSAEKISNYQITPSVPILSAVLNSTGKKITLATGVHGEGNYQLAVHSVTDRAKNPNPLADGTVVSYPYQDKFPPTVKNLQVISETELRIRFSEPVEKNSAEKVSNYSIDRNIQIISATLLSDNVSVELQTIPHGEGSYHLTLNGIKDRALQPNSIAQNTTLEYHYIDTTAPTVVSVNAVAEDTVKILFSEPMAQQKAENKANYAINNGVQILSAKLAHDGKTVMLRTTSHGEGNYQLEMNNLCDRAQMPNFIAAHTTVSYQFVDSVPPRMTSVEAIAPTTVIVNFSEPVNSADAEKTSNYSINRGINVLSVNLENNGVQARLTTSLHNEGEYHLQLQNVRDRAQNPNVIPTQTLTYNYVDHIVPEAISATVVADSQIDVRFSEPVERNSAENVANYRISPEVSLLSATLDEDTVTVHLLTAHHAEGSYVLHLNNIKDISSQKNLIDSGTALSYEYVDQIRPTITGVEAAMPTEVRVSFSEKVTAESAENIANYSINNNIEVQAARLDSSEATAILTTTAHQPGNYIIIIDNIKDRAQQPNTILPHSYFTYSYTDRLAPDVSQVEVVDTDHLKVVFNERVQKISAENANNFQIKTVASDVDVWQLSGKRNFNQNDQTLAGGGENIPVEIQSLSLEINERVLHIFTEKQKPGDYMLAVKNIKDCAPQPNALQQEKKIFYRVEDLTPPTIASVQASEENQVEVIFSEPVVPEMATDTANYKISKGIRIFRATIDLSMTKVTLKTSQHENGEGYQLAVENIEDMSDLHNKIAADTRVDYIFVKQNPDKPQIVNFVSLEANGDGGLVAHWDSCGSNNIVSYKVYYGIQSQNYNTVVEAGDRLSFTLVNLSEGVTYFAAITAVNNYGMESNFSHELSATVSMRDVMPPEVAELTVNSDTTLTILFSESVARNTAEEIGNYQIDRGVQVLSASLARDGKTLFLQTTPHVAGEYLLSVSGIEDLAPNPNLIRENYRVSYYFHPNDRVPPVVADWRVISQNKLELVFSELVEKSDAERTANYLISPAVTIYSANFNVEENSVILTTENHVPGVWYTMKLKNIRDLASPANVISADTKFQYQFQSEDNTPPEIYFVRAAAANKILVQFTEGVDLNSAQKTENYQINAGVEISRAERLMDLRTIALTTSPLRQNQVYEISAQQISDLATPANTLTASKSYQFVFNPQDFTAPRLLSVEPLSATKLKLIFSEFLNRKSAELLSNYSIDKGIAVVAAQLGENSNSVYLTTSTHSSGLYYRITVNGIKDTAPIPNIIRANTVQEYYFFQTDKTPPVAENCELKNAMQLEVTFDEIVSRESAENVANYLINPYVAIRSALLDSSLQRVILETDAHEPGKTYQILITGIADRADPPNRIVQPQRLIYTLPPETDFIADNLIPARYEFAYLSVGDTCYLDANERIQSVPKKILGGLWIRTAQADANSTNSAFLAFRLKKKATVFVGVDPDVRNYPDWLIDKFYRTGEKIGFDGEFGTLDLWQAELDTGFVILGGNMAAGAESIEKMYVVIIKPESEDKNLLPDGMDDPLSRSEAQKFQLIQNYPNPFNAETKIQFAVSEETHVKIELFNILGQQVRVLLDRDKAPGRYLMLWDGKDANGMVVATGVYFMRMTALKNDQSLGGRVVFRKVRKMLFIR
ncbi:MAG: T9SS type A sorting domain-containing protein [Calditrichaeota bacterium]|nr:T9SS type A sorting domain-containing protein [Calditrichota bacterium]